MNAKAMLAGGTLLGTAALAYASLFTVPENGQALVLQFGKVERVVRDAGEIGSGALHEPPRLVPVAITRQRTSRWVVRLPPVPAPGGVNRCVSAPARMRSRHTTTVPDRPAAMDGWLARAPDEPSDDAVVHTPGPVRETTSARPARPHAA